MLPAQQEAHEISGGDGLDLAPAPLPGVGVDARKEPARAILLRPVRFGEVPADGEAFRLELRECAHDQRLAQSRGRRELRHRGRATALKMTAKEIRRCGLLSRLLRCDRTWMIRNGVRSGEQ